MGQRLETHQFEDILLAVFGGIRVWSGYVFGDADATANSSNASGAKKVSVTANFLQQRGALPNGFLVQKAAEPILSPAFIATGCDGNALHTKLEQHLETLRDAVTNPVNWMEFERVVYDLVVIRTLLRCIPPGPPERARARVVRTRTFYCWSGYPCSALQHWCGWC